MISQGGIITTCHGIKSWQFRGCYLPAIWLAFNTTAEKGKNTVLVKHEVIIVIRAFWFLYQKQIKDDVLTVDAT